MRHVFLATAIVAWTGIAAAQTTGTVSVTNAWARATAGESKTGAAYVTLTDSGAADRLIGASTPVAGTAQVHQTINANGVMQMRPVDALPLEPGKPVTLAPGSYHIMLTDLHQPLKRGETFPLTLTFDHAKPVTVQVKVAGPGAMHGSESSGMGDMKGMDMSGMHKP